MMFTKKDLLWLIVPLIIESVLGITLGMEDSMMVSHAGAAAVSGVSLVDTISSLLVLLFSALATGGAVVIAQAMGAGRKDRMEDAAKHLILSVTAMAVLVSAVTAIFRVPLLKLIFGSVEQSVMDSASDYFLYRALSYPFMGLASACSAIFRAIGKPRISMGASFLMNGVNIVANAVLIFGLDMGVTGAALGTTIARMAGALLQVHLLRDPSHALCVRDFKGFRLQLDTVKKICGIGIPSGIENSIFQLGKVLTQSLVATFATAQIAANGVCNTLTSFEYTAGSAVGLATVTVVGRCIGAGQKEQAKQYLNQMIKYAYLVNGIVTLFITVFRYPILGLYHLEGEALELANQILIWHAISIWTVWPLAFTPPQAFRAAGDVRYTMVSSMFSMWVFRVGFSYLLNWIFHTGVMSVWYAMTCDWIFRAIIHTVHRLKGKWLNKGPLMGK